MAIRISDRQAVGKFAESTATGRLIPNRLITAIRRRTVLCPTNSIVNPVHTEVLSL